MTGTKTSPNYLNPPSVIPAKACPVPRYGAGIHRDPQGGPPLVIPANAGIQCRPHGGPFTQNLVRYTSSAMPHTEPAVNVVLANILRPMFARATVAGENTGSVVENPALQLDVLITAPGRSPVSIETEFMPARTVEDDALSRLGKTATRDAKTVEAAIALRYPEHLRNDDVDISAGLLESRFTYAVFTQEGPANNLRAVRFPESGWLEGDVGDLAILARLVSVPEHAVDQAATSLEAGINMAASVLAELDDRRGQINIDIAKVLGMENVEQTRRMASAIVANAMVFHERIVGMHPDVHIKTLESIAGRGAANPKGDLLDSWRRILTINYHPIFDIARRIVECLPAEPAARIIRILGESGNYVSATGIDNAHDLTGRVFQRLISDRKYLATFYTRPASAALLAQLAVAKLQGIHWSDPEAIGNLRIADFACGTGALLSAVYEQIASRHADGGGNPRDIHTSMLEDVLVGCDVMPSAVHITAATLAGIEPDVPYSSARLYTMPYGRQPDGGVRLGSLEFLVSDRAMTLVNTSAPAVRVASHGEESAEQLVAEIPDESLDLIVMNPPFTRNVTNEGVYVGTYAAAFAAFGASEADQRDMAKRMERIKEGTCYHGNAGIASAFAALADRKLKIGGILALILPLTATTGLAWQEFRSLIGRRYTDLSVETIAAANDDALSFSSDTGMAECLVIARKRKDKEPPSPSLFTSLGERPRSALEGWSLGSSISGAKGIRSVYDGPYGGTPIGLGSQVQSLVGETISVDIGEDGAHWGVVRISDYAIAQSAEALANSTLWLPGMVQGTEFPVDKLSNVGALGRYSLDITGAPPRGPFDRRPPSITATYPSLWNHNASNETRLICQPDSQLAVRAGLEEKAAKVWVTASRAHISIDFRFTSQPLAGAYTETKTIGGRAWPNVLFEDDLWDKVFILWVNSSLGLLSFWWNSGRQQGGRGMQSIRAVESMPVLDFRELAHEQLATAERIFDEFREKEFMPAYLADADPNRDLLDRRVVMDLLGFDEEIYLAVRRLAQKWCAEPSVQGGKARPPDAHSIPGDGPPSPTSPRMNIG